MLKTVQGIYKDGKIELSEVPQGITESIVFVTFLETQSNDWPELIMQHNGIEENIIFESYRDELIVPNEVEI